MVRLHIRGADANYRRLRHHSVWSSFLLHHKANLHPCDKKEGQDCVVMTSDALGLKLVLLS